MAEICRIHRLGNIDYLQAWELQNRLAEEIARGVRPPTLLLLEHPHTYTFGRRGQVENLLWDEAELEKRGVSLHWVDRGGDITYHGPGQLVGYPLLPLAIPGLRQDEKNSPIPRADYIGYLRRLEEVLIHTLASLNVPAVRVEGLTGVWVLPQAVPDPAKSPPTQSLPAAKIAAIGVKVDARGVTRHGFALNIDTDPEYWQGIIACGIVDHVVISLAELIDPPPAAARVMEAVIESFGAVFQYEVQEAVLL
jgi:lipoyl(octanoyl) transferase